MISCLTLYHYPLGEWYEKLKKEEPRAIFVYREWPDSVFGKCLSLACFPYICNVLTSLLMH